MTVYNPPLADMHAALNDVAGLPVIATLPGCESADAETVAAILEEAAKFATGVLAPLNPIGDKTPAKLENGAVRTSPGFKEAYRGFVDGGWNALPFDPERGGQGLPASVSLAVSEMWNAAGLGFALCPLLTAGAVDAIEAHGTEAQKSLYLPKMISGEWTGTMNLTEPQAGSDVGALRTRAVPDGDAWRITGQKIYITFGDHDYTDNIIHLVLARTPGAPAGTRGISMFIVPKFLVNEDGSLGARNDVRTVSLEHKLGIHGSPTAVLSYGDEGGAIGYMLGREHRGMENMFTMMNGARLNVGLQGIAVSDRAYQQALAFARTRVQGKPIGVKDDAPHPIIEHPDVRRMLLQIKSTTEAARGLAYYAAGQTDFARHLHDDAARAAAQLRLDLMIPLVKAWSTDIAVENCSLAVQIHGGMGFIEETGVAQHYRDVRILPIYEGTNGIQALDLLGRKLGRDKGKAARDSIAEMQTIDPVLASLPGDDLATIRAGLSHGLKTLSEATETILGQFAVDPVVAVAGAVPYLTLFAATVGAWTLATQAVAASRRLAERDGDPRFNTAKLITARFFVEQILPKAVSGASAIAASATVAGLDPDLL
jgi:alkylation response protein AidB-like acyl-CoA dehydrogenase